jgi:uncharacterized protein (TIGR01777 family)
MNIAIAGGTGFVGKALTEYFRQKGHHIYILTRKAVKIKKETNIDFIQWLTNDAKPHLQLPPIDVIINLAGESINSGRWNELRKKRIVESRLSATKAVYDLIANMNEKPKVLIQASAIGIYGTSLHETFTEKSLTIGRDFLAKTVQRWEEEAKKIESLGVRTVLMRFGMILGKDAGALPRILLPYKWFIGGTIGSGKQWMSWVHIHDVVRAIEFAMMNKSLIGPVNVTAPQPTTMKPFGQTVAHILKRPHWLPVPAFALKLLLGEMSTLVLEGQNVLPEKLMNLGFIFSFPTLEEALENILQS